jgi:hypothetical protein
MMMNTTLIWRRLAFFAVLVFGALIARPASAYHAPWSDCTLDGAMNVNCFHACYYREWWNGQIIQEVKDVNAARKKCTDSGFPDHILETWSDGILINAVHGSDNFDREVYDYYADDPYVWAYDNDWNYLLYQGTGDMVNYPTDDGTEHIRWWAARWGGGPGGSGAVECDYKSYIYW